MKTPHLCGVMWKSTLFPWGDITPLSWAYISSSVVAGSSRRSYRWYNRHTAIMTSTRARCIPMQFRGPVLKGRNPSFISSVGRSHLSGLNDSGSGNKLESR